jgi:hypothetical protein
MMYHTAVQEPAIREIEPRDQKCHEAVRRVLASASLSGSEALRHLLVYLAEHTAQHPGQPAKEGDIAAKLLGRHDFDAREDSTVRVHAGRLRSKLAEYYLGEGAGDEVIIQIPKGAYQLVYQKHKTAEERDSARNGTRLEAARPQSARRLWFLSGWIVAAVAVSTAIALWWHSKPAITPAARDFWAAFIQSDTETLVIFSNPRLAGDATSGLEYYRDGTSKPLNENYTGTGTAMAIQELSWLFGLFQKPLKPKRAQLLTWDEARNRNVILVGNSESNLAVTSLPRLREFDFKPLDAPPRAGQARAVVNEHPRPGEQPYYFVTASLPYRSDYAIVALQPGLNPSQRCLLLAGTNTYGTQAAAEYVTDHASLAELMSKLKAAAHRVPFFEALLEVTVNDGVPVRSKLLLVRVQE